MKRKLIKLQKRLNSIQFNPVSHVFMEEEGGGGGGGGGGNEPTFLEGLSEDLRGNEALANFTDADGLAKSFVELKGMQGSSIRIPGEDAGNDAMTAFNAKLLEKVPGVMLKPNFDDEAQSTEFYRTLGMPEKAEGYVLPEVEVPDGVSLDTDRLEGLKSVAHKYGITGKQFTNMMNDIVAGDIADQVAAVTSAKEAQVALKEEWGMAHGDNMKAVANIAKITSAPEGLMAAIEAGELGPDTAKWMLGMAKAFKGEGSQFNDEGGANAAMTPGEAQLKISEMLNNKKHPYWNPRDTGNKAAMARMLELQKFANPGAGDQMVRAGFGIPT